MRKVILVIIAIIVLLLIAVKAFNFYNASAILSNQAVFKIHLGLQKDEIDSYFNLPQGTYNEEDHVIVCKLPVKTTGFKPETTSLIFGIESINCGEEYNAENHVKYDNTEFDGTTFELLVVNRNASGQMTSDLQRRLASDKILSTKYILFDFAKGKINNIVISANGAHEFCPGK